MSWNLVKNIWFWCRENRWKMSRWVIEINTDWSSTAEKHLPVSSNKSGFVSQHPVKMICSIGVHGAGCCADISSNNQVLLPQSRLENVLTSHQRCPVLLPRFVERSVWPGLCFCVAVHPDSAIRGGGGDPVPAARRGVLRDRDCENALQRQLGAQRRPLRLHQPAAIALTYVTAHCDRWSLLFCGSKTGVSCCSSVLLAERGTSFEC